MSDELIKKAITGELQKEQAAQIGEMSLQTLNRDGTITAAVFYPYPVKK